MIKTKEHYDLMSQFEKTAGKYYRLDKEPKDMWHKGRIYQSGEANNAFLMFRDGYEFGKCVERMS